MFSFSYFNCMFSSNFPSFFLEMVTLLLRKKYSDDMRTLFCPTSSSSDLRGIDDFPTRVMTTYSFWHDGPKRDRTDWSHIIQTAGIVEFALGI